MISQIFLIVLNMSITASMVIAAVLAVRQLIKRLPKIFSYCLWGVVLFRLLCPVSFTTPVSFWNTMGKLTIHRDGIHYISQTYTPYQQSPEQAFMNNSADMKILMDESGKNSELGEKIIFIASCIWILGFIIILTCSIYSFIKLKQKLKKTAVHDIDNIYITQTIGLPFVFGILKPAIYLPSIIKDEEREYILLHEQIHIARKDYLIRSVSFFALCLHWYNPFVWFAFITSGQDMEMSCDEAVIRKMGSDVKRAYASSILSLSTGKSIYNSISLSFGKGNTKKRIMNVLSYKKHAVIMVSAAAALCFMFAFIFASNAEVTDEKENQSSQVFYGVVSETHKNDLTEQTLILPGYGEVEIPETAAIAVRFERNEQELLPGDMVCLKFPAGENVSLSNTSPPSFQSVAEYMEILWSGCSLEYVGRDNYLFSFARAIVPDSENIKPGDILEISWQVLWEAAEGREDWDMDKWKNEPYVFYSQPILKVEEDDFQDIPKITIRISSDDLLKVFNGFGNGITFSFQKS